MAIDHILFNKLKWFNVADNADSVTANNKAFLAIPTQITVPDGFQVNLDSSMYAYNDADGFRLRGDNTAKVVAVGKYDYILHPQQSWNSDTYRNKYEDRRSDGYYKYIAWLKVPKNQAKNIKWGGKAFLNAVTSMLRRVVAL